MRRIKWSVVDEPIVSRQDWVDSLVGYDNDHECYKKIRTDEKNKGLVVMVACVVSYQEWR